MTTSLEVKIGSYTFPSILSGSYSVTKQKYNAFAERTAKTMRIDQLGDVWRLEFTLPSLPDGEYKKIADALGPFVVSVEYFNEWTNRRQTDIFYHTDLKVTRISQRLRKPLELVFIGTEVI